MTFETDDNYSIRFEVKKHYSHSTIHDTYRRTGSGQLETMHDVTACCWAWTAANSRAGAMSTGSWRMADSVKATPHRQICRQH